MGILSKLIKTARVLKIIFFEKIPMNLSLLIIIILISAVGFNYIKTNSAPTGNVVLEQPCPECICEEKTCEQDCDLCPIKTKVEKENIIYYTCPGGALVEDLSECEKYLPDVSEQYSGKVSGITLSIEDIQVEKEGDESGCVTQIGYTIINKGESPIVPRINVKVYKEWDKDPPKEKELNPEIVVNKNDYISRKDAMRICFQGKTQTLRLMLTDILKYPNTKVIALRDFDLDYLE